MALAGNRWHDLSEMAMYDDPAPRSSGLALEDLQDRLVRETDPARRLDIIDDALGPPEPQLLDTSVLQNLDWVDREIEGGGGAKRWDEGAERVLIQRYGQELAQDLLDLGTLYKRFEDNGNYPWLICNSAIEEADVLRGIKGDRLRQLISCFSGHQDDWSNDAYPGIARGLLLARRPARVSPLILRALGVASPDQVSDAHGPLSFLPDRGDRLLAAHALLSNIPAILTTDRRTFWSRREEMKLLGVHVIRPSELLALYLPYWDALELEFARRGARRD
jgi:hypothetical protein